MKTTMTIEQWKEKSRIGGITFTYRAEHARWEAGDEDFRVTVHPAEHGPMQGQWFACLRDGVGRYMGCGNTPAEALDRAARDLGRDAARGVKRSRLIVRETEKEMFA